MRGIAKKVFSVALAATMLLSGVSTGAFAEAAGPASGEAAAEVESSDVALTNDEAGSTTVGQPDEQGDTDELLSEEGPAPAEPAGSALVDEEAPSAADPDVIAAQDEQDLDGENAMAASPDEDQEAEASIEQTMDEPEDEEIILTAMANDTKATAATITLTATSSTVSTGSVSGFFSGAGTRWYKVTLPSCGRFRITKKGNQNFLQCSIYSPDDTQIGIFSDTASDGGTNCTYFDLTKGTYYIKVNSILENSFTLEAKFTKSSESFVEAQGGSNNSIAKANTINLDTSYKGQLAMNDTKDFYKFAPSSAGRITLTCSGKMSVRLTLYDASQSKIWSKTAYKDSDGALSSKMDLDLTKGTYYLLIEGQSVYDTGGHSFKLAFASAGESFSEAQGGSNNSIAKASAISLGKTYKGQIAINDNKDYYKFTVNTISGVTVKVDSTVSMANFYVYDASESQKWKKLGSTSTSTPQFTCSEKVSLSKGTYYFAVVPVTTTGTGNYSFSVTEIRSIEDAVFSSIPDATYTGKAITPKPTVKYDGKALVLGTDYTLSYSKNIDAGRAVVTATGKGSYTGKKTASFTIVGASIANATVAKVADQKYTGKAITPKPTVTLGGKTLVLDTDYTLSYKSNVQTGTATITVKGKGNYTGTKTATFNIVKPVNIALATASGVSNTTYTGAAIKPKPTLVYSGKTLVEGTDYTLSYANNVNVGTASVTITGKGKYTATKKVEFRITKASVANATIAKIADQKYTGKAITPKPVVTFGGKTLVLDTDYTLSYKSNVNAGTATAIIAGKGNFAGSKQATFKIVKPASKPTWSGATRMPVSSAADYKVTNGGWIRVKVGGKWVSSDAIVSITAPSASVKRVTAKKAGTTTLYLFDKDGKQVATRKLTVYALSGNYEIQSIVDSGYVLDIRGQSKANSARMIVWPRNNGDNQRYQFVRQSDGTYGIKCVHSGKYVDVQGGGTKASQPVIQYTWNGGTNQRWKITVDASNYVTFVSAKSGMAFDIQGGKVTKRAQMIQYPINGGKNQKWLLNQK